MTERIGYWIDLDHAYYTYSNTYIESVWWALAELWRQGLLVESYKIQPYCARCGTTLSSHEVAQNYRDTEDPSIWTLFPALPPLDDAGQRRPRRFAGAHLPHRRPSAAPGPEAAVRRGAGQSGAAAGAGRRAGRPAPPARPARAVGAGPGRRPGARGPALPAAVHYLLSRRAGQG